MAVFEHVFLNRQYLQSDLLPSDPKTIIDVGANIGLVSILFAQRYPHAKIVALEPEDSNYRMLQQNTAAYPQITTIQGALWDRDGEVEVQDPSRGAWAYYVRDREESGQPGRPLSGLSMGTLLAKFGIERVDILKIDVEGAEERIFAVPCDDWLKITRSIVIELHDRFRPGCSRAFYSAIGRFPFVQDVDGENIIVNLSSLGQHK